ncbi:hypothetical protein Q8A67_012736 [Cirrhinus molitorella]|uniref:BHLH domain-containing protein n=2 Tax=Cirrhinus TaxID=59897 RepID=A0AA88PRF8_9TELE|nr:hypothetical protein Q8A67_012736 [Cirrhinus molitorella]
MNIWTPFPFNTCRCFSGRSGTRPAYAKQAHLRGRGQGERAAGRRRIEKAELFPSHNSEQVESPEHPCPLKPHVNATSKTHGHWAFQRELLCFSSLLFFFPLREMDITAKMEISVNQQQFMPPACFFASQSIQLSPTDSQCSSKSGSKQTKRQRSSSPELLRCKRRLNFAGFGYSLPQQQPHAVARRNERERNRVKLVNNGFATLREHVPNGAANKKMSKVETLRSAVEYIRALQQLLDEHDAVSAAFQSGVLSPTISQNYSNDMNSMAGSPVSSYSSDEGSYDPLSPEEQELLDFTNWF